MKKIGSIGPYGAPILRTEILANSITVTVEDSVKVTSGFIALGTTAALVFGHVNGIVRDNGTGLLTTGAAGAAIGSFVNAYTTASDNQTVGKVRVQVDISKDTIWSATPDAAIGTTTGSNLLGYHTNLATQSTTSESSATTSTAQYTIWGVDPATPANQMITIYQSQVLGV